MKTNLLLAIPLAAALGVVSTSASATLLLRTAFNNAALSIDGFGGNSGSLQTDTPSGATILRAFLYSSDVNGGGVAGDVTLNGSFLSAASGTLLTPNNHSANHRIYDVTSNITAAIALAGGGLVNHSISEGGSSDGETLVVVYRTASTLGTAIILDGELSQGGDITTLSFLAPYAGGDVFASIADSFSFNGPPQNTGQVTLIDVTTSSTAARRLTSCAGGNDDGGFVAQNGFLLTAGGVGDSPNNPDPNCTGGAGDDELYNLALGNSANASPFLTVGDTSLTLRTNNPSFDDNVYGLFLTSSFTISEVDDTPIPPEEPPTTTVPEPSTLALLGLGWLGAAGFRRRRSPK